MANASRIEWTDACAPVVTGCDYESPGCKHCYARRNAWRLAHNPHPAVAARYDGTTKKTANGHIIWTGTVHCNADVWDQVLRTRRPTRWFVSQMGDLFHRSVPDAFLDRSFEAMRTAEHHTFFVLTKRAERAAAYLAGGRPLPNVLIGASTEDQVRADQRRPHMRRIADTGWRTFVSYEPALSMVDWRGWEFLEWLISGGESGAQARPSHPDWHRSARDFCALHNVLYFFKQWGEYLPADQRLGITLGDDADGRPIDVGTAIRTGQAIALDGYWTYRIGKKAAGRLLDGVLHDGVPTPQGEP